MTLVEYKKKRRFNRTPEPKGKAKGSKSGHLYVIQKHAASRLHYDFRLELDGVLKSWAVPKGPSLDPSVKSLAVHVEDHPVEYGNFEGVIPEGEYGGGTVMLWDRGTWEPEGDARKDYRRGKLTFQLHGEKLRGRWVLVRMWGAASEDGKNWLLKKLDDDEARPESKYDVREKLPKSVSTKRSMEQIASAADRVWTKHGESKNGQHLKKKAKKADAKPQSRKRVKKKPTAVDLSAVPGAKRRSVPANFRPQLATLVKDAPESDDWLHELKFDGYRLLCIFSKGRCKLVTRHGHDWTDRFPTVAAAANELGIDQGILDGEIVVLDKNGTSDFQALQNHLQRGRDQDTVYFAFDLPFYGGYDLTQTPLIERKKVLQALLNSAPIKGSIRYSDHIIGRGAGVFENACRHAIEGVISKRVDSPYEQRRSRNWVKVKCLKRQEFVVAGWSDPSGSREAFGSLVLGYHNDKGDLVYSGRVGTGFTSESLQQIKTKLDRLTTKDSPFTQRLSASDRRGVHWVKPRLVAEVEFTQWTEDGILRHPTFQGLREDKLPREVTRELPTELPETKPMLTASSNGHRTKATKSKKANRAGRSASAATDVFAGVRISNPDRIVYPEQGLTKRDLAAYYESVGEWILPFLRHRPITLVRCPQGRQSKCFYQKHITESIPEPIRGVKVEEKDGTGIYVTVDDVAGVISLVQIGVLEMHPWGSREDKLDNPDQLVFDLDPGEGVQWNEVVKAAFEMRSRLDDLGLKTYLRTTGGKGLHVVAPLKRRATWDDAKEFAKAIADACAREHPDRYVATASKAKRRGKIYVDYLRNDRGSTAIASYSTRARAGAPVATPLDWDELTPKLKPVDFNVNTVPARLSNLKKDPWQGFFKPDQAITKSMMSKVKES